MFKLLRMLLGLTTEPDCPCKKDTDMDVKTEQPPYTTSTGTVRFVTNEMISMSKDNQEFLADFSPDRYAQMGVNPADVNVVGTPRRRRRSKKSNATQEQTIKVAVTPKSVLGELERRPTMNDLNGLLDKIDMLEVKLTLVQQYQAQQELRELIELLKNRLRYTELDVAGVPFSQFFSQFDSTDDQKIKALCDKHDLVKKEADIFVPELPNDAVKIMAAYTTKVKELTGRKPRYYVIATASDFKQAYGKRDPILIVQSPFGFYYYILGAWDTEMLYLPEL